MFLFQELLPDHLLKEAKVAADKSKGTGVQWPFGWGKKKGDKELEALPTPEAEVLKVWPSELVGFNATATRHDKGHHLHCSPLDLKWRATAAHGVPTDAIAFGYIADNMNASHCMQNMVMASISAP